MAELERFIYISVGLSCLFVAFYITRINRGYRRLEAEKRQAREAQEAAARASGDSAVSSEKSA